MSTAILFFLQYVRSVPKCTDDEPRFVIKKHLHLVGVWKLEQLSLSEPLNIWRVFSFIILFYHQDTLHLHRLS